MKVHTHEHRNTCLRTVFHSEDCSVYCAVIKKALYLSFLQNFTHNAFWFLGDTQGAGFYDKHGTTLHLFVILFPVQYMEKRFALETREYRHSTFLPIPAAQGTTAVAARQGVDEPPIKLKRVRKRHERQPELIDERPTWALTKPRVPSIKAKKSSRSNKTQASQHNQVTQARYISSGPDPPPSTSSQPRPSPKN